MSTCLQGFRLNQYMCLLHKPAILCELHGSNWFDAAVDPRFCQLLYSDEVGVTLSIRCGTVQHVQTVQYSTDTQELHPKKGMDP